jgi:hypothetical protein
VLEDDKVLVRTVAESSALCLPRAVHTSASQKQA